MCGLKKPAATSATKERRDQTPMTHTSQGMPEHAGHAPASAQSASGSTQEKAPTLPTPGSAPTSGAEQRAVAHRVQFYDSDAFLLEAVNEFLGAALGAGTGCIVFATG